MASTFALWLAFCVFVHFLLLPPPGCLAIRRVCLFVGSFVDVFVSVFVCQFAYGHRLRWRRAGMQCGRAVCARLAEVALPRALFLVCFEFDCQYQCYWLKDLIRSSLSWDVKLCLYSLRRVPLKFLPSQTTRELILCRKTDSKHRFWTLLIYCGWLGVGRDTHTDIINHRPAFVLCPIQTADADAMQLSSWVALASAVSIELYSIVTPLPISIVASRVV